MTTLMSDAQLLCLAKQMDAEKEFQNYVDQKTFTPAHALLRTAINKSRCDIAQLAIDAGAHVDSFSNGFIFVPLHHAVRTKSVSMCECLIAAGADTEAFDFNGHTPLLVAAASFNYDMVAGLLAARANIHCESQRHWNVLSLFLHHRKPRQDTKLDRENAKKIFALLLSAGANVHHVEQNCRQTPLHIAISTECAMEAQMLIDAGADITARSKYGSTPISLARRSSTQVALVVHNAQKQLAMRNLVDLAILLRPLDLPVLVVCEINARLLQRRKQDDRYFELTPIPDAVMWSVLAKIKHVKKVFQ